MWLSWLEHCPVNQKVMGLIPGEGTCLGCGFCLCLGCAREANNGCFSLTLMFLSFSLSLSLKSASMSLDDDLKNKMMIIDSHRIAVWIKEECKVALAGIAQWIECRLANQSINGSIPSQGTCLGCGPGPQQGMCKRHPHIEVSLPLFLPPFHCLKNK